MKALRIADARAARDKAAEIDAALGYPRDEPVDQIGPGRHAPRELTRTLRHVEPLATSTGGWAVVVDARAEAKLRGQDVAALVTISEADLRPVREATPEGDKGDTIKRT